MNKIAFDIDGTIVDLYSFIKSKCEEATGKKFPDPENYFVENCWDISKSLVDEIIDYCIMDYENIPIFKNVDMILRLIQFTSQSPLIFITARPEKYYQATCNLLRRIIGANNFCLFMNIENKVDVLKSLEINYFIEDRRKNVLEISKAGITVFMPKMSYNALPETERVVQLDNIEDLVYYL